MDSSAAVEEIPVSKPSKPIRRGRVSKEPGSRRSAGARTKAGPRDRYFLADGKSGEAHVSLGRELASDKEAIVAAFQEQTTFYVLNEFRVEAEFTGRGAELVKKEIAKTDPQ
ncbi:MAG: hypothetical protein JO356_00870 [Acidobacteria bacterium]|nr:hypothetical protein [Acidobacteriota bacterium]